MGRRRFRLVQLLQNIADDPANQSVSRSVLNQAATVQQAEPAGPSWMKPSQRRILELQQQMGNASVRKTLGAAIQRAPKAATAPLLGLDPENENEQGEKDGKDKKEKKDALKEQVNAPENVEGVNDQMDWRSLLSNALTAYKNKKYAIALLAFRQLMALEPRPGLLINIAIIEMRLDMFKEAKEDLENAVHSDALTPEERSRAIAAYGAVEKLNNANAMGFLPLPSNVDTEASPMAKDPRAIRHQVQSLYRTAEGAAKSEDYDAAFNAFKIAQDRLPHPVTMVNMGKILLMLQRYSEAASIFDRALHDRTMVAPVRKVTEAELEQAKRFQSMHLDDMGEPPPLD